MAESVTGFNSIPFTIPSPVHSTAGRPKVNVDCSHVQFLRSLHFSWSEISSILNISVKILRRAKDWNFTTYTNVSDDALDSTIRDFGAISFSWGSHA